MWTKNSETQGTTVEAGRYIPTSWYRCIAISCSGAAFAIAAATTDPYGQWGAALLWLLGVLYGVRSVGVVKRSGITLPTAPLDPQLVVLTILGVGTRWYGLEVFPFPAIGEEVRDTGMEAHRLLSASSIQVFGWGPYQAHGLLTIWLALPFEALFGPSVVALRGPAALLSSLEVPLLYLAVRQLVGKPAGVASALALILFPFHLYISRTQLVVLWSSFLTTAAFALIPHLRPMDLPRRLFCIGLYTGVALGFHASLRSVAVVLLLWGLCGGGTEKLRAARSFLLGAAIALGPRLLYLNPTVLMHSKRLFGISPQNPGVENLQGADFLLAILFRIFDSYRVFYDRPLMLLFPAREPIIPAVLLPLFLLGLIFLIRRHPPYGLFAGLLLLIVPITNSGVTDVVNGSHRLAPLIPLTALCLGTGAAQVVRLAQIIRWPLVRTGVGVLLTFLLLLVPLHHAMRFFLNPYASKVLFRPSARGIEQDFLARYIVEVAAAARWESVCIVVPKELESYMGLLHVREYFKYFLPGGAIETVSSRFLPERTVELRPACRPRSPPPAPPEIREFCREHDLWRCPNDGQSFTVRVFRE